MFTEPQQLDLQRIWDGAVRLLDELGLVVQNPQIIAKLTGKLRLRDGRLCFPPEIVAHFAEEIRQLAGSIPREAEPQSLRIYNSPLNWCYIDSATSEIMPHTVPAVIKHTKLCSKLADEGRMGGGVAGIPTDVPPLLQYLTACYIQSVYSRHGSGWGLFQHEGLFKYFFAIDEVMGYRKSIWTEMISPLKMIGGSIDAAAAFHGTDVHLGIDPMPILGVTAPADWHLAWAQSVAENLGCYIAFRLCEYESIELPSFRLFVPNLRACTTYFSAPQHILALLMRRKVRAFFGLDTRNSEMMLVASKAPDQQAAMEKMAGALLGKMHGFTGIEGAGGLWLDEIFSPQQLMIDLEIADFVNSIATSLDEPEADIVAVLRDGITAGGFLASDLLIDRLDRFSWRTTLSDLSPRAAWDGKSILAKTADRAEAHIDAYTYELTDHRREALEHIMADARREFGG